jgi:hypothetical protein
MCNIPLQVITTTTSHTSVWVRPPLHRLTYLDKMETPRSEHTHTNATSRTASIGSGHEQLDYLNLPVREVSDGADLREYTTETRQGEIIKPVKSNATGKLEDWKLVTFTIDDPENPKNWSKLYKWYCTMVVAFTCFVVAFASSVITADLEGPMEDFNVSREVSLVVVTVFVIGFGVGKLFVGSLPIYYGSNPV